METRNDNKCDNRERIPGEGLYEYAVIRYVPRVEREEFINVGLVMMCKRSRWMRARLAVSPARLAVYDCAHTPGEIEEQLGIFLRLADGDRNAGPMATLPVEERFRWLTAVKSSCIQTSRPHPGTSDDLDITFDRLFDELVM